jgi:hypothetical protein
MENVLEMARRHVMKGREIARGQRALVNRLRSHGRDTANAEKTLQLFEQSLKIFEDHLKAIERDK